MQVDTDPDLENFNYFLYKKQIPSPSSPLFPFSCPSTPHFQIRTRKLRQPVLASNPTVLVFVAAVGDLVFLPFLICCFLVKWTLPPTLMILILIQMLTTSTMWRKRFIEEIGKDNVIQVCTDNASNYVMAGKS